MPPGKEEATDIVAELVVVLKEVDEDTTRPLGRDGRCELGDHPRAMAVVVLSKESDMQDPSSIISGNDVRRAFQNHVLNLDVVELRTQARAGEH